VSTRSVLTACAAIGLVIMYMLGMRADEKAVVIVLEREMRRDPPG
jgi:hypothetical protein